MSLARAFTTRRARQEQPAGRPVYIGRAASQRSPDAKPIVRSQISLPVALISTTNMLSYDAPDIAGTTSVTALETIPSSASSDSGHSSDNESDRSTRSGRSNTLTDMSSIDGDSPATPATPEPNHLSCYFKTKGASISPSVVSQTSSDSPIIPQRAASHSKTAHVQLSHKRSMQRMASQKTRESTEMFNINSSIPSPTLTDVLSHPFGKELEQLSEVQEEFNGAVRDAEAEADRLAMASRDLMAFCASDYMAEIFAYYTTAFEEDAATFGCTNWI